MHTEFPLSRKLHEINEFFGSPPAERLIAPAGIPPLGRAEREALLASRAMYFVARSGDASRALRDE